MLVGCETFTAVPNNRFSTFIVMAVLIEMFSGTLIQGTYQNVFAIISLYKCITKSYLNRAERLLDTDETEIEGFVALGCYQ